ncbi:MAG: hypothetical protein QN716_01565 [Nitrososphaeraceae archaeon]|nr:hypothetical protein [Nitrososphaeraceae archaeon]
MNKKDYQLLWGIFLIVLLYAYCGCSPTKKSAAQKAYDARQSEIALLQKTREMFPCDTQINITIKRDTTFEYMTKDTVIYLQDGSGDSIVYIDRYHTIEKAVDRVLTVIDRAEVQSARDSIHNAYFLLDKAQEEIDTCEKEKIKQKESSSWWRRIAIIFGSILLIEIVYAVYKTTRK